MDACDPRVDIKNLKKLVKQNTGTELNLTRDQICNAYSAIQANKLPLPPLVLSRDGMYMTDRKSPLNPKEYETLFASTSTVAELKRVARKVGLTGYNTMTKAQMIDAVVSVLKSKNIHEPIRLHVRPITSTKRRVSVNYPNNFNVNNRNGNGLRNENQNQNQNVKLNGNSSENGNMKSENNENKTLGNISRESQTLGNNNQPRRNGNNNQPRRSGGYYEAAVRERARENNARARMSENNRFKSLVGALGATRRPVPQQVATRANNTTTPKNRTRETIEKLVKFQANKASRLRGDVEIRNTFLKKTANYIQKVKNGDLYNSQAKQYISSNFNVFEKQIHNKMGFEKRREEIKRDYVDQIKSTAIRKVSSDQFEKYGEKGLNTLKKLKRIDERLASNEINKRVVNEYLNAFSKKSSNNINTLNSIIELTNINKKQAAVNEQVAKLKNMGQTRNQTRVQAIVNKWRMGNITNINAARTQILNLPQTNTVPTPANGSNVKNIEPTNNGGTTNQNAILKQKQNAEAKLAIALKNLENAKARGANTNALRNQLTKAQTAAQEANAIYKAEKNALAREVNAATASASNAERRAENMQMKYTASQTELSKIQTNMENIQSKLNAAPSENQRRELEQQLLTKTNELANAQNIAQKAKANANAAVAESRRLVDEARRAANEAMTRAQNAEQARIIAEAATQSALGKKEESNLLKIEANRLKAEANAARKAAQNEAKKSANAAAQATNKANAISRKLEESNLSIQQRNALIKEKNDLIKAGREEMQKQISAIRLEFNTYKQAANKIVRNSANRIQKLEVNRNRWQSEFNKKTQNLNLATQRLSVKNANLTKRLDEIKMYQSNITRLQKELNNSKSESMAEKNTIKKQLEKEKQNLTEQFAQTRTNLNATKSELTKLTSNRNILFKELQTRSNALGQTRVERNALKQQLEETKKILGNTQSNLGRLALAEQRAKGQRNTLSKKLASVRGQRQNLRSRNNVSRKVITGLQGQRLNLESQLKTAQSTSTLNQKQAQATINATRGQLKTTQGRLGALQGRLNLTKGQLMKTQQNMGGLKNTKYRQNVYALVNIKNINGKHVMRGGLIPGAERRKLKDEIMNPKTNINRLRQIEVEIRNRKSSANKVAREKRNANEGGNGRYNFIARDRGTQTRAPPGPNTLGAQTQL